MWIFLRIFSPGSRITPDEAIGSAALTQPIGRYLGAAEQRVIEGAAPLMNGARNRSTPC